MGRDLSQKDRLGRVIMKNGCKPAGVPDQCATSLSNPRVMVSWQILKLVQPKAEDVQAAWEARI
jgi:hypothetical protein